MCIQQIQSELQQCESSRPYAENPGIHVLDSIFIQNAAIWKLAVRSGTQALQALTATPDGNKTRYIMVKNLSGGRRKVLWVILSW